MFDIVVIVLEQAFLLYPLILGAYISISLIKVPDLSIESAYLFGAICGTKLLPYVQGLPKFLMLVLVLGASIIGGLSVGLISSLLTKKANIPHLLSSILTIGLFHGINQWFLGTSIVSISQYENPLSIYAFSYKTPELCMLLSFFIVLFIVGLLFFKTQLGYAFSFYGNNPVFFDNYGISSRYIFITGIMIGNALAGISGYFVAQSSGFSDVNAGSGIALFCVTCLVLGKLFEGSKKTLSICIPTAGILAYCSLQQALLLVGFNLKYFTMIQSLIVLLILIYRYRHLGSKRLSIDNLGV